MALRLDAPGNETARDRVYTDNEIKRLWEAKSAYSAMILMPEPGCAVAKSLGHLGHADYNFSINLQDPENPPISAWVIIGPP